MRFKNYYNYEGGNRRIYTLEDILNMKMNEILDNENAIAYQYRTLGMPKLQELEGSPYAMKQDTGWHALREDELDSINPLQGVLGIQGIGQESIDKMQQTYSNSGISTQLPNEELISPRVEQPGLSMSDTIKLGTAMGKAFGKGIEKLKSYNKGVPTGMGASITDSLSPNVLDNETDIDNDLPAYNESFVPRDNTNTGGIGPNNQPRNYMNGSFIEEILPSTPFLGQAVKKNRKTYIENSVTEASRIIENAVRTIRDNYRKGMNLETDYSKLMTNKEKIMDSIIKSPIIRKLWPMSSDMYTDGMTNFSRARQNPNAKVVDNMSGLDYDLQQYLKKYGVKDDERGVLYDKDSKFSKKLGQSEIMKDAYRKNYDLIKSGKISSMPVYYNKYFSDEHNSIQSANIINPKINEDDSYSGRLIDNVDYNRRIGGSLKKDVEHLPNNHGVNMQNKGLFENYFPVFEIEGGLVQDEESKKPVKSNLKKKKRKSYNVFDNH